MLWTKTKSSQRVLKNKIYFFEAQSQSITWEMQINSTKSVSHNQKETTDCFSTFMRTLNEKRPEMNLTPMIRLSCTSSELLNFFCFCLLLIKPQNPKETLWFFCTWCSHNWMKNSFELCITGKSFSILQKSIFK